MSFDPVTALLAIPAAASLLIALLPGSRLSAYVNAGASFLTFLAGLLLLWFPRPAPGPYLLVDEFNTIFIVLITFVGFTTSVFSATMSPTRSTSAASRRASCGSITRSIRR